MKAPAHQGWQVTSGPQAECASRACSALSWAAWGRRTGAQAGTSVRRPLTGAPGVPCSPCGSRGAVFAAARLPPEGGLPGPAGRPAAARAPQQKQVAPQSCLAHEEHPHPTLRSYMRTQFIFSPEPPAW